MNFNLLNILFLVFIFASCADKSEITSYNLDGDNSQGIDTSTTIYESSIAGKILTEDVFPTYYVPNAMVRLSVDSLNLITSTNDSGLFKFVKLSAGNYILKVTKTDYDTISQEISLDDSASVFLNISLSIILDFEQGVVLMGIADTVSFKSLFKFVDSLGLKLMRINYFQHETDLIPQDSAKNIFNEISGISYLNSDIFKPQLKNIGDSSKVIISHFFNMDRSFFIDWFNISERYGLMDKSLGYNKNIDIEVPPGHEKEWLNMFKSFSIARWITLNYYLKGEFFKYQ